MSGDLSMRFMAKQSELVEAIKEMRRQWENSGENWLFRLMTAMFGVWLTSKMVSGNEVLRNWNIGQIVCFFSTTRNLAEEKFTNTISLCFRKKLKNRRKACLSATKLKQDSDRQNFCGFIRHIHFTGQSWRVFLDAAQKRTSKTIQRI